MNANPYRALDVPEDATDEELRAGFTEAVKRAHPDGGGSPEALHAVVQAYDVLKDKDKRRRFDSTQEMPTDIDDPDKAANVLISTLTREIILGGNDTIILVAPHVAAIRKRIVEDIEKGRNMIAQLERREEVLGKSIERTSRKKRNGVQLPNLIAWELALSRKACAGQRYAILDKIITHTRALAILDAEYEDIGVTPMGMTMVDVIMPAMRARAAYEGEDDTN